MTTQTALAAVSVETNLENGSLALTFGDGDTASLNRASLSDAIRHAAMLHGLKQKLVDAAAIPRNVDTGRSATVAEKKAAVLEVLERLLAGEWNKTKSDGTGAAPGGLLHRALCQLYAGKMDSAAVTAWLEKKDKKAQADLRANPRIASVIADLKAADAARKNPGAADDMLAELDGLGEGDAE